MVFTRARAAAALAIFALLTAACGPAVTAVGPGHSSEPASVSEPVPSERSSEGAPWQSDEAQRLKELGLTPPPARVADGPLRPDEAGQVMILMYHIIDAKNSDPRWTRTPQAFRQDLETLYSRGYRPVNAVDVVEGRIDVPRGYTPVVLTFDDSSAGQFRLLPAADHSEAPPETLAEAVRRLDPDSAVGILVAFHEAHPDWALRGTFYVNAGGAPFGQPKDAAVKLRLLTALGFEIGNHTLTHENLKKLGAQETTRQLGANQNAVARWLPGYEMRTLALPFGGLPKAEDAAKAGTYEGHAYRNDAFLLVGSNPAPSPFLDAFDPYRLPRVQAADPALNIVATFPLTWLAYFDKHPERRFVSDGDPDTVTVPRSEGPHVRAGKRKIVWSDGSE